VHKRKSLRCALLFNEGRSGVPPIGLKMSREAVYRLQVILEGRFAAGPLGGNSGVRFQAHLIAAGSLRANRPFACTHRSFAMESRARLGLCINHVSRA
jgi:hypothetical protein